MPSKIRQWTYCTPMLDDKLGTAQFSLREVPVPALKAGEALVRVKLVNIHSGTRRRMASGLTKLGDTDRSNFACGEVVKTRTRLFKEGDLIACQAGWQDFQVVSINDAAVGYGAATELVKALNGTNSQWTYAFRPAMSKMWPPEVLMEIFGTSGMTAYFGMRECGPLMPRDVVAMAAATGSVGSIAAQLAKTAGCSVVGFAGGENQCTWATNTLEIDSCLDYRAHDFAAQLEAVFARGIDVFSDGVGGSLTESVVSLMNTGGRLFSYGAAAAAYADRLELPTQTTSLREWFGISATVEEMLRERNIKSEAWIVDSFYHERLKAEDDLSRLMLSGALKSHCRVADGFENLPDAIVGLYQSGRSGKLQVRFST